MRSLSVLFALPWIYSGGYFAVVAALAPRDPNQTVTYWIFGMVLVCVVSVIVSLNIKRRIAGAARLALMLLVVLNLIAAIAVSAGVGLKLFPRLFRLSEAKHRDGQVVQRVNHADLERARRISRRARTGAAWAAASAVMTIEGMPAGAGVFCQLHGDSVGHGRAVPNYFPPPINATMSFDSASADGRCRYIMWPPG